MTYGGKSPCVGCLVFVGYCVATVEPFERRTLSTWTYNDYWQTNDTWV